MKKRRTFSSKQKSTIVLKVIKDEKSVVDIGKEYNIAPSVILRWRDEFIENADKVFKTKKEEKETNKKIKKYEHVISKITTQNDFLEKVLASLE